MGGAETIEIKQLEYFLAVAEHGSFSRAAVMLSVAQPVLSRYVRSLEVELGSELFYRNGRGVVVSESGEVLVSHARNILNSTRQITADVASLKASPGGRLILGLPPTANMMLGTLLVQRIRELYPRVKLKIQEGYSRHVLEWLSTGRIDVAILYNAQTSSTLLTQPLIEEELCLIGPTCTPQKLREAPAVEGRVLAELPLILPSNPHGLRRLVEACLIGHGVEPNVEYEIDALPNCLELVEGGYGYTVLPYASVRRAVMERRLVAMPLIEPKMTRKLVLATSTQRPMTATARALAGTVSALVKELVRDGSWLQDTRAVDVQQTDQALPRLRVASSSSKP